MSDEAVLLGKTPERGQPGPWGIYPMQGWFHVTREARWGEKAQEYAGSFRTREQAEQQVGRLVASAENSGLLNRLRELLSDHRSAFYLCSCREAAGAACEYHTLMMELGGA